MKGFIWLTGLLMSAVILAGVCPLTAEEGGLAEGDDVMAFTLFSLNNSKRVNLKKYFNNEDEKDNKVVVLTFFASWCKPCKKELPHLQKVYEKLADKGLEIMAVFGEKDQIDWAKSWWEENKITFLLLNDEYGIVKKRYEIAEYPTSFIFDRDGKLAKKITGFDENIEKEVEKLLTTLVTGK